MTVGNVDNLGEDMNKEIQMVELILNVEADVSEAAIEQAITDLGCRVPTMLELRVHPATLWDAGRVAASLNNVFKESYTPFQIHITKAENKGAIHNLDEWWLIDYVQNKYVYSPGA